MPIRRRQASKASHTRAQDISDTLFGDFWKEKNVFADKYYVKIVTNEWGKNMNITKILIVNEKNMKAWF